MANQALISPLNYRDDLRLLPDSELEQSLWQSLKNNFRDAFFPEKLPPLKLTSRPVRVREIWGESSYRGRSATGSLLIHGMAITAIIVFALMPKSKPAPVKQEVTELVAPDISAYMPVQKPQDMGGGGGGGDRDKLQAPKGKLPKVAPQQITPPAIVIRNENPKLAVEPTVVMPPTVKIAEANVPAIGIPTTKVEGPASNGIGASGGIGSGESGGVGSGIGAGVGPGEGGGTGGGIYRVGGGVSAPRVVYAPDPEYTEEARKAKYQGVCVLWLIVGPDGRPRDVRVARTLGMGLDQKAVKAVQQWKFEPAMKNGQPVAVMLNVEVNFRLY
jgi:TonB family protein